MANKMADFSRQSSNIGRAAQEFLFSLVLAPKTKRRYEDVLWLFIESLKGDGSSCEELANGTYVLKDNWDVFYGGAISGFIDWFLPRKVMMNDDEMKNVPGILRKFIQWRYDHKFFDEDHYEDLMDALPKSKSSEVKRLRELEDLLYHLHSPDPGAWPRGEIDKVTSISQRRSPEKIEEGYMTFLISEKDRGFFKFDRKRLGPVLLSEKIVSKFKRGDIANLTIGRYQDVWMVLETGNVYPEGSI